jgi:AcrR family transcriptional regulator
MDSPSASDPRSRPGPNQVLPKAYAVRSERERLLEAMIRLAAVKGYEATTIDDVLEAARVPREAFEQMFGDKETCFLESYDAVVDVLVAHMSTAFEVAAEEPWTQRVIAALRALVELLASEAEIASMAMVEVTAGGEEARIRYRAALGRFTPFLEGGLEVSPQGKELPPDTARFAIGGAVAMIFDEVRSGRGPELVGILPDLAFVVLMPYLGAKAAEAEMRKLSEES